MKLNRKEKGVEKMKKEWYKGFYLGIAISLICFVISIGMETLL